VVEVQERRREGNFSLLSLNPASIIRRMPAAMVGDDGQVMACAYVPRSQRSAPAAAQVPADDCVD